MAIADGSRLGAASKPDTIALCLSGGGFRAALFHLGAVRRLNELGILSRVTTITSVSGAGTLAGLLARKSSLWSNGPCSTESWEAEISAPFRAFTTRNLSTPPSLYGWLPWNWRSNRGVKAFATVLDRAGICEGRLGALTPTPRFVFCATDLVSGAQRTFDRCSDPDWPVSHAVAASSCFPGVFRPFTTKTPQYMALMDGGVSDNRGVEPVWRAHGTLLVSDGGDVLRPQRGRALWWSLVRSAAVLMEQMQEVQKRWILGELQSGQQFTGAYWGLGSVTRHYPEACGIPGYQQETVRDVIARVRLGYDVFSDAEAAVLENHGYLLTDAAIRSHQLRLHPGTPLHIPHPAWLSDRKVADALEQSWRTSLLGRGALRALLTATPQVIPTRGTVTLPPPVPCASVPIAPAVAVPSSGAAAPSGAAALSADVVADATRVPEGGAAV